MKHSLEMGIALLVSAISAMPALAQEGDARSGLTIAQDTCAACHAIRKGQQSTNADAPAFDKIANVPGMTAIAAERGGLSLESQSQLIRGHARDVPLKPSTPMIS